MRGEGGDEGEQTRGLPSAPLSRSLSAKSPSTARGDDTPLSALPSSFEVLRAQPPPPYSSSPPQEQYNNNNNNTENKSRKQAKKSSKSWLRRRHGCLLRRRGSSLSVVEREGGKGVVCSPHPRPHLLLAFVSKGPALIFRGAARRRRRRRGESRERESEEGHTHAHAHAYTRGFRAPT